MSQNERKIIPLPDSIEHWKQLKDNDYIGHWDLPKGQEAPVTIESVVHEEVYNPASNEKEIKPVISFKNKKKRMILNTTNMEAIASIHGVDPKTWPGKQITLFRGTTKVRGKPTECVRVRSKGHSQPQV